MEENEYKLVVGLEIHIEPKTDTKMFCNCKNDSNETIPNTNVCPICMGNPGMLPVPNKIAIEKIIKLGLALGCEISPIARFDRKNYFYPDLPKGYQITQNFAPFCLKGELPLFLTDENIIRKISLHDIHLEEDAGKLLHTNDQNVAMVDFNRAGVPLIELVSEPVIYSAEDARLFGESLQLLMNYLDISNADMEKGEMRVEVNVSLGKEIDDKIQLGQKVEVKNINSFSAAVKAIEYEKNRQLELLKNGEKIVGETRGWNDVKQMTFSQRLKEESNDYRYFPEPDLVPVETKEFLNQELPELPWERRDRFIKNYMLDVKKVLLFLRNKELGDFFEKLIKVTKEVINDENKNQIIIDLSYNYLTSDFLGLIAKEGKEFKEDLINSNNFATLIKYLVENKISSRGAKIIIEDLVKNPELNTEDIIKEKNLIQVSDEGALTEIVKKVLENNPDSVSEFKNGKESVLQFLVGQIMKESKGSANPQVAKDTLLKLINL